MTISQTDRLIRIATPLGDNTLIMLSISGNEKISALFEFQLELASERNDITFEQLAGQAVTIGIKSADSTERYINGIIVAFSPTETSEADGLSRYAATMKPALWLLTRSYDCRIFQDKSIPEIIEDILSQAVLTQKGINAKIDYRLDLSSNKPQDYCVQYNESDFAFLSRNCENEGIFYFFEHENGKHTLVFADTPDKHKPFANGEKKTVPVQKTLGATLSKEVVTGFKQNQRISSATYSTGDYNFIDPETKLAVSQKSTRPPAGGSGEIYEFPGKYEQGDQGRSLAAIRMQANDANSQTIQGRGNCRGFTPGFTFTLKDHPIAALNGMDYTLTYVYHSARQALTTGSGEGDHYSNIFACLPQKVACRPVCKTPRPFIASSQTAIVTGPSGEEIHTDEHGRVKVHFHWDRRKDENKDGNMSCWIRVSQTWAGSGYGAIHIPRVGQEVIVNFIDGDPDRPLITGRVYHGKNLPPYKLPQEKTKSTIMSRSTKNGGTSSNEIRFDDLKGSEEYYTHASKDQNEVVENNMTTHVKGQQQVKIEKDRAVLIISGNETLKFKAERGMSKSKATKPIPTAPTSAGRSQETIP